MRHSLSDILMKTTGPVSQAPSVQGAKHREKLLELFRDRQMPDHELMTNFGLFMRSGALAKILFLNEAYQMILPIPGVVCEFGVWWGQSLAVFENLRAVYEPYNYTRKIVGFDTFTGYAGIGESDKASDTISSGVYGVPDGYENVLTEILSCHQQENVISHIKKFELVKGSGTETGPAYFAEHPEALVALAFFDMALYEPTKACLEAIKPRLVKGSVIAFDELNNPDYPGETKAALEVLGTTGFEVRRSSYLPDRTFFIRS